MGNYFDGNYPNNWSISRLVAFRQGTLANTYSTIKDEKRYDVQVSDTTMMIIATSLFGQ